MRLRRMAATMMPAAPATRAPEERVGFSLGVSATALALTLICLLYSPGFPKSKGLRRGQSPVGYPPYQKVPQACRAKPVGPQRHQDVLEEDSRGHRGGRREHDAGF